MEIVVGGKGSTFVMRVSEMLWRIDGEVYTQERKGGAYNTWKIKSENSHYIQHTLICIVNLHMTFLYVLGVV